jgi:hypothetical protein
LLLSLTCSLFNTILHPQNRSILGFVESRIITSNYKESPAMYRPNFCVECGERLTRPGWRALIRSRFCPDCNHRLGASVYAKTLVTVSLLVTSAFAMGRYLRPQAPPLIIQRAANSPLSDSPLSLKDAKRAGGDTTKQSVESLNPIVADGKAYICGARTKKGTPCHRRVHAAGERCFQHKGMPSLVPQSKLVIRP